ncbi:hypothetical protein AB0K43_10855 [Kitasatospora sp. NPDC049258]|uniref:hypothetical protein n=1 Tax=Kitasatospora sp. NPDC049258 TaxID=3155394 RepID=UPI00342A164E
MVQAAGTDAWTGFRERVAQWFGRGDGQREQTELARLDRTAIALETVGPDERERVRIRQEASWQARFETVLEGLEDDERVQVAARLRALLEAQAEIAGRLSAGAGSLVVAGGLDIRADQGSIAAGVIHGGANISTPSEPAPSQG